MAGRREHGRLCSRVGGRVGSRVGPRVHLRQDGDNMWAGQDLAVWLGVATATFFPFFLNQAHWPGGACNTTYARASGMRRIGQTRTKG